MRSPQGPALADPELLAAIVTSAVDAVVSADTVGNITSWNPAAEALYGVSRGEALGQPLKQVLTGHRRAVIRPQMSGDAGGMVVEGSQFALHGDDGAVLGTATIAHDVSDRVAVEEQLAATRLELEAKNRGLQRSNTDLEEFAYIASHDLSEPLRAIAGMVSLLARRYEGQLDADADDFIGFAVDGCERMRRMIDDLLSFSKTGQAELVVVEVPLGGLVASVLHDLGPQIEASAAVVHVGELPTVHGDASQLAQVLRNLLSNALKFRRSGEVTEIRVRAERGVNHVRVEVSDNGIGIDEQYRERIFRMFKRLHLAEDFGGTGIGLAIAKRVVERHGGRIGVTGNRSGGCTFWFTLPASEEDQS